MARAAFFPSPSQSGKLFVLESGRFRIFGAPCSRVPQDVEARQGVLPRIFTSSEK